jgi:hypothetical protein
VLSSLLRVEGSPAEAAAVVAAHGNSCRFIDPALGHPYRLNGD